MELKNKIDDQLKCTLLDSPWKPDKSFKFPVSDGKKTLKFQMQWFDRFQWLVYPQKDSKVFYVNFVCYLPEIAQVKALINN